MHIDFLLGPLSSIHDILTSFRSTCLYSSIFFPSVALTSQIPRAFISLVLVPPLLLHTVSRVSLVSFFRPSLYVLRLALALALVFVLGLSLSGFIISVMLCIALPTQIYNHNRSLPSHFSVVLSSRSVLITLRWMVRSVFRYRILYHAICVQVKDRGTQFLRICQRRRPRHSGTLSITSK